MTKKDRDNKVIIVKKVRGRSVLRDEELQFENKDILNE